MEILALAVIIIIVLAGEALIYKKFSSKGLEYSITLSKTEANEGDLIEIIEQVTNNKLLPIPWLRAEISTSKYLDFVGTTADEKSGIRFVPSIFALKSRQRCTRRWQAVCKKRGVFSLSDTTVTVSDLFGFARFSVRIPVNETITVLPSPCGNPELMLSADELFGDVIVRRFICDDPFLISGAKEYTGREPMNRIHWSATAREGVLMAMSNDYTTSNVVLLVINLRRENTTKVLPVSEQSLEDLTHTAAGVVEECRKMGIRTALMTNEGLLLEPDCSAQHYLEILRALSKLECVCEKTMGDVLLHADLRQYSDLVILSKDLSNEVIGLSRTLAENGTKPSFFTDYDGCLPFPKRPLGHFTEQEVKQ